jgi:putative Holliday junction resolvase
MIKRKKFTLDAVAMLAAFERDRVGAAVIGLPVNMDGSEGPRVQATRAFVRNMAEKSDLPFVFWDERLSTVAAERALIEMDVSRKKRKERIDSAAASFILQGALDRLTGLRAAAQAHSGDV